MTYTITKYAQSCILIEKDGARCLIDPGVFVKEMDGVQPADWPHIDLILVTHEHSDHYDPETIKSIVARDQCPVLTNAPCAELLRKDGVNTAHVLLPGERYKASFTVVAVAQEHGDLPNGNPKPGVVGFVVDGILYAPGDSLVLPDMPHADVLFVPVAGPEMTLITAKEMVQHVAPKVAVPVHFSNIKMFPISLDEVRAFIVPGVDVHFLADKESMQWTV